MAQYNLTGSESVPYTPPHHLLILPLPAKEEHLVCIDSLAFCGLSFCEHRSVEAHCDSKKMRRIFLNFSELFSDLSSTS